MANLTESVMGSDTHFARVRNAAADAPFLPAHINGSAQAVSSRTACSPIGPGTARRAWCAAGRITPKSSQGNGGVGSDIVDGS
jgi:hypothetical protein